MRKYKYIGLFRSNEGHEYTVELYCNGTIQAFILLTAEGIKTGLHYQLFSIVDEEGNITLVKDICLIGELLEQV